MIENLMNWSGVTEARLRAQKEIPTDFGQTLNWEYLLWVRAHPVRALCPNTAILYATGDELIPRCVIDRFVADNPCRLTLLDGGQHWLHTEQELAVVHRWEEQELNRTGSGV